MNFGITHRWRLRISAKSKIERNGNNRNAGNKTYGSFKRFGFYKRYNLLFFIVNCIFNVLTVKAFGCGYIVVIKFIFNKIKVKVCYDLVIFFIFARLLESFDLTLDGFMPTIFEHSLLVKPATRQSKTMSFSSD